MSGFDPLSYAAAREARPPAGAVMPALQVDPTILAQGWCQLDGSLVSRAAYPDAAKIVGDVRFFNGTPNDVVTDLVMRANVNQVSSFVFLAFGSTFIAAPQSYGVGATDITAYRLWRSTDAGANWAAVDLPAMPRAANQWRATTVEWFGGGRVLMVFTGVGGDNRYTIATSFSNDSGATWSAPKELASVATSFVSVDSISSDAEMVANGTGYYYVGVLNNGTNPVSATLFAINPADNTVRSYAIAADGTNAQQCRILGGRVVAGGTSEVHFAVKASGSAILMKLTFDGATFSGYAGTTLTGVSPNLTNTSARQFLTKGGDGNYYWMSSATDVQKLPAGWAGAATRVHVGHDNIGRRLLTNTLSNSATGQRYDTSTGVSSVINGMGAGRGKVGTMYGHTDRVWTELAVIDKTPSADRHFVQVAAVPGSCAVRTTRAADNFVAGLGDSLDATRFLSAPVSTCTWYDPATGQLKVLDSVNSPVRLRVRTYAAANDYAAYAHLPYLPGLMARMR